LAFLPSLAVQGRGTNRQDAKNAKQSEKSTDQTAILRAIPSVEATPPIKNFPSFPCFPWTKIGCGRQPTPSLFVWFVVKKSFLDMI
jgi:hypothetical protein